eukprot:6179375-Pleurochrysis_carterae.AAC.1
MYVRGECGESREALNAGQSQGKEETALSDKTGFRSMPYLLAVRYDLKRCARHADHTHAQYCVPPRALTLRVPVPVRVRVGVGVGVDVWVRVRVRVRACVRVRARGRAHGQAGERVRSTRALDVAAGGGEDTGEGAGAERREEGGRTSGRGARAESGSGGGGGLKKT